MIRETFKSLDGRRTAELQIDGGRVWATGLRLNSEDCLRGTDTLRFRDRLELCPETGATLLSPGEPRARAFCEDWVASDAS